MQGISGGERWKNPVVHGPPRKGPALRLGWAGPMSKQEPAGQSRDRGPRMAGTRPEMALAAGGGGVSDTGAILYHFTPALVLGWDVDRSCNIQGWQGPPGKKKKK